MEVIDFDRKSTTGQRIPSIFLENADSTMNSIDFLKKQRRPESDFDDPLSKNIDFGILAGIPRIARKWRHPLRLGPPYLTRRSPG